MRISTIGVAMLLALGGCSSGNTPVDMQSQHDFSTGGGGDMAMGGGGDMAMAVQDMAMGGGNTVMVANGGLSFSPSTLTVSVGSTVTWKWATSNHTVTSGDGNTGTPDNKFCSPNDTNCATSPTSMTGAIYSHTFTTAGTYPYFCRPHAGAGMTGTIIVQ
jgi:plastocyanin